MDLVVHDALELYSRRTCLLVYGVPDYDTTESVISLCKGKLDDNVSPELIEKEVNTFSDKMQTMIYECIMSNVPTDKIPTLVLFFCN